MTWCVVYNGSEQAQIVDEEGRTVYPTEFTWARRSVVRDLTDSGALVIVDMDTITDGSNIDSRMAKEKATQLNDAIDADKAAEDEEPVQAEEKTTSTARKRTNR